jgi:hypothetical protein
MKFSSCSFPRDSVREEKAPLDWKDSRYSSVIYPPDRDVKVELPNEALCFLGSYPFELPDSDPEVEYPVEIKRALN